jgi:hypothetical protein
MRFYHYPHHPRKRHCRHLRGQEHLIIVANARPMTGSVEAIQSRKKNLDRVVAFAPLRKRFAFVAGDDAHRRSRGATRPRLARHLSLSRMEGAGKAGRLMHPQPRMQK